ncbi:MBL fold metallo-hydrolase [Streptomyces sp. NPDC050560]|uniref:MBL fold metallo-hydrolase n=1 Tax=Streptomyces sp. NPDC050560 TaxID=3365630 RepID=UPI0037B89A43
MCEEARNPRRRLLAAAGALGAAAALPPGRAAASTRAAPRTGGSAGRGASVILLGTQGGPPPDAHRAGIASALVVDGATYLVDAGRGAVSQYAAAGLAWADLRAVFVTHLHADHVADLFQIFLFGGFQLPAQGDTLTGPVPVYGPGPAGGLPPVYGGGHVPTAGPGDPTPGLAGFLAHADAAFAYSTNVFLRDSGVRAPLSLADAREIPTPADADFRHTAPDMRPFTVMEDERVRVSAVLVPHGPVFPAFAFRFDTDHGSVTFSGDTTRHRNLVALARGSDVLVHEAINVQGWSGPPAVADHLVRGHVEVQDVGRVAQSADVDRLVLSHIGDMAQQPLDPRKWQRWAQRGYGGRVLVGSDLDAVSLR